MSASSSGSTVAGTGKPIARAAACWCPLSMIRCMRAQGLHGRAKHGVHLRLAGPDRGDRLVVGGEQHAARRPRRGRGPAGRRRSGPARRAGRRCGPAWRSATAARARAGRGRTRSPARRRGRGCGRCRARSGPTPGARRRPGALSAAPRRSRTSRRALASQVYSSRPIRRAASPIRPRSSASSSSRPRAAARAAGCHGRHQQAGLAVADDLRRAVDRRRDHREAAVHRLAHHRRQALAERRQHEEVAARHRPAHLVVGHLAEPVDPVGHAELGGAALQALAHLADPGGHQAGRAAGPAGEDAHRLDQRVHALARHELADVARSPGRRRARPGGARASAASRGMKTAVSAPFGTTSTGRRGMARPSAASAIARLTAQTWSMPATASSTRRRLRGPWAGTSSTSARWAVATTGTPRRAAHPRGGPAVGHEHVRVEHLERPAPVHGAQRPGDRRGASRRSCGGPGARRAASACAGRGRARRRRCPRPAPRGTPCQRGTQRRRPALGRDHAHVVAERHERPHLLVHEDPAGPVDRARVHVAEHQDADGVTPRGSSPARRASTSAPIPRPNMIHIGAKWIAVDGPRLPVIQPISDSAPARDM